MKYEINELRLTQKYNESKRFNSTELRRQNTKSSLNTHSIKTRVGQLASYGNRDMTLMS